MGDKPPLPPPREEQENEEDEELELSLSTFQSSSFDCQKFVTKLMQKDVQLAKTKSGGGKFRGERECVAPSLPCFSTDAAIVSTL
jgi:hypothetical protein